MVLASLAMGVYWFFLRIETRKFFQKDDFTSNVVELTVHNKGGDITIEGFDEPRIETTVYYKVGAGASKDTSHFIKINVKDDKANINVLGNGNGSVHVYIKVPRSITLKEVESSVFGGNITIKNIEGPVRAIA